jgi:hypothetical protein
MKIYSLDNKLRRKKQEKEKDADGACFQVAVTVPIV